MIGHCLSRNNEMYYNTKIQTFFELNRALTFNMDGDVGRLPLVHCFHVKPLLTSRGACVLWSPLYVLFKKKYNIYSFFIFQDAFLLSFTVNNFIFIVSSRRRDILDPTLATVTTHKCQACLLVEEFSKPAMSFLPLANWSRDRDPAEAPKTPGLP